MVFDLDINDTGSIPGQAMIPIIGPGEDDQFPGDPLTNQQAFN
jgi:hypothetical protein